MDVQKLNEILNLSKEEKLELVQILWDNISKEYISDISDEQIKLINDRLERIDNGESKLIDLNEFKKRYIKFE